MLGRRKPQRSLFSAQSLPHQVDPDSFYGRMGAVSSQLFNDDDLRNGEKITSSNQSRSDLRNRR